MSLKEYEKKRDFKKTAEPKGRRKKRKSGNPIFVVQKHDASRLHYDFRLEVDDVLKSWAVPKGPSNDPSQKRLAVPTEDHPMEYADFEGVIPEGEYGAGTVMVWDTGTYETIPDEEGEDPLPPTESFERGQMKIRLHGKKMKGDWVIVNMKGKDEWLLIKKKDNHTGNKDSLTRNHPKSAVSGKTLDEIAED
jgi:DNA ligase D-like protein (predicted 3'-phosphoesterase)